MNRQHQVPAKLFFYVMKEYAELVFASSRFNIPRWFSLSDHHEATSGRKHIRAKPIYLRRMAVEAVQPVNKASEATLRAQRCLHRLGGPQH